MRLINASKGRGLNSRQRQLVAMLADGCSMQIAADRLGSKIEHVRAALQDPLIKAELAAARDAKRMALQPRAVDKLGELIDHPLPAIALQASKAILGDDAKTPVVPPVVNVGVQVNNQAVSVRPGYAYRLPPPKTSDDDESD